MKILVPRRTLGIELNSCRDSDKETERENVAWINQPVIKPVSTRFKAVKLRLSSSCLYVRLQQDKKKFFSRSEEDRNDLVLL